METPSIRQARPSDLEAIDRIYDHYVRTSTCTFQLEPAGLEAQALKWVAAAELGGQALLPADQPIVEVLNSHR